MSEGNMKSPENKSISDQKSDITGIQTDDQIREEATQNFIHQKEKPKPVKKNFLKTTLGKVLTIGGLIAVVGTAAGIGIDHAIKKPPEPTPSTFDVSAMKSTIGPSNSVQMTLDEYAKTAPPIWDEQNKTMTVAIPIFFANNRNPTLGVEKVASSIDGLVNQIQMDDLEPGDVMFSPDDGTLMIQTVYEDNLTEFDLEYTDSQGETITITGYSSSLKPLISFADATPVTNDEVSIPIKKDQPIGEVIASDNNPHVGLIGFGPFLKKFNLAVNPEGKAIILTK
jgi:hypothetical protein